MSSARGDQARTAPEVKIKAAIGLAVLAFVILRLVMVTRYPLWTDETWTLDITGVDLRRTLRGFADDQTHPPLFYLALWVWRRVGPDALLWWRLLPVGLGIATAGALLALAREARCTPRATLLAVLLGAGSGILVGYSGELRNYTLLALLGTMSLTAWLRVRDGDGAAADVRWLTGVNAALLWTHYFGAFLIIAEWCDAALGARRRLRAMTLSAVLSLASLAPWAYYVMRRAGITGTRLEMVAWLEPPTLGDLLDVPLAALGGSPWLALDLAVVVVAGAVVAVWLWRSRMTEGAGTVRLLALAAAIPIAMAFVASVVGPKPMWLDRYLIATVPPLLVLVAISLDGLASRAGVRTAAVVACALMPAAFTVPSLVRGNERLRYDLVLETIDWRDAGSAIPVFAGDAVDGRPMLYAIRTSGAADRMPVSVVAPRDVTADSGWYVWSERHPPAGLPPVPALWRAGYETSRVATFVAARNTLMAVRFVRSAAP